VIDDDIGMSLKACVGGPRWAAKSAYRPIEGCGGDVTG
jgi:hypothetical protein